MCRRVLDVEPVRETCHARNPTMRDRYAKPAGGALNVNVARQRPGEFRVAVADSRVLVRGKSREQARRMRRWRHTLNRASRKRLQSNP